MELNHVLVVGPDLETHIDFRDMESAVQITAANIPVDQNTLYFYFGKDVAPNGYFWIFPKGHNKANIGLGVSGIIGKKKSAQSFLDDFMNNHYPNAPVLNKNCRRCSVCNYA